MVRTFLLIFAFLVGNSLTQNCGSGHRNINIGFPVSTPQEEFPFVVNILQNRNGELVPICSGTTISRDMVLTAAQCVGCNEGSANVEELYIMSRSSHHKKGYVERVIQGVCHPEFDSVNYNNDIAVLKVDKIYPSFKPAPLESKFNRPEKSNCYVVDFGKYPPTWQADQKRTIFGALSVLKGLTVYCLKHCTLYKHFIRVIGLDICEKLLAGSFKVTSPRIDLTYSQMCARTGPDDNCNGVSGGPLVCEGVQVGILSWNEGCPDGTPSIYGRVVSYEPWIHQAVRNLSFKVNSNTFYYQ